MPDGDPPLRGRASSRRKRSRPPSGVTVWRGEVRVPLALARVRALAELVLRRERAEGAVISIQFVSPRTIARWHHRHLGVRGPTDIVTLEHAREAPGAPLVGEVLIAPDVAAGNAARFGVPVRDEIARLVVHGVLHAVGWDHPEDESRTSSGMWRRQETLLRGARQAGVI